MRVFMLARTTAGVTRSTSAAARSEEHTSELQSHLNLVCRLLLEKKKKINTEDNSKQKLVYAASQHEDETHVTYDRTNNARKGSTTYSRNNNTNTTRLAQQDAVYA